MSETINWHSELQFRIGDEIEDILSEKRYIIYDIDKKNNKYLVKHYKYKDYDYYKINPSIEKTTILFRNENYYRLIHRTQIQKELISIDKAVEACRDVIKKICPNLIQNGEELKEIERMLRNKMEE